VLRLTPFVALIAAAPVALAIADDPSPVTVTFYGGGCSMTLPAGWDEIPPDNLEELSMWVADATSGRSVEIYQYGYHPPDFETDPWLPHLLVQIRESGRLPYGRFLHLPPVDEIQSTADAAYPRGLPPLIMGVAVERISFDRQHLCLRLEHSLDLRFKGPVRVLTAAFLTERGLLALHYVDRERRADDARLTFDGIVDSVSVNPDLAYRPRLGDRWPGLPYFIAAGIVALILVAYLVNRRRRP
jgi:hypothetical protein